MACLYSAPSLLSPPSDRSDMASTPPQTSADMMQPMGMVSHATDTTRQGSTSLSWRADHPSRVCKSKVSQRRGYESVHRTPSSTHQYNFCMLLCSPMAQLLVSASCNTGTGVQMQETSVCKCEAAGCIPAMLHAP